MTPSGLSGHRIVLPLAGVALVAGWGAGTPPALAHGIGEGAAGRTVLEFVPLGAEHMILGWDHLLFILGVVILAGNSPRAAKLVTLFVIGHSLTLLVATIAGWQVSATLVDVVIALSLVYVGVLGIRSVRSTGAGGERQATRADRGPERSDNWRLIGATIFGFGLIHGLGLSTRLQDLGLPDDGLVARVIAFNVGVEIGQLSALIVVAAVGYFLLPRVNWPVVKRVAYAGLVAIGLVAAVVLSVSDTQDEESAQAPAGASAASGCEQSDAEPPGTFAGGHPPRRFYGPGETAPGVDLEHVIGDGYVVVRYRPDLAEKDVAMLRDWVDQNEQIIGAPAEDQEGAVKVTTAYRELTCAELDMAGLSEFTDTWFTDVREGKAQ